MENLNKCISAGKSLVSRILVEIQEKAEIYGRMLKREQLCYALLPEDILVLMKTSRFVMYQSPGSGGKLFNFLHQNCSAWMLTFLHSQ